MIDHTILELIQNELDGSITDKERLLLKKHLAENDETQTYLHEMRQVSELLGKVPHVDPPLHLKAAILNSVDFGKYTKENKARFSFVQTFFPTRQIRFAYVITLCIGLILGIAGYFSLVDNRGENLIPSDASGNMISEDVIKDWKVADQSAIVAPMIDGSLMVRFSDEFILMKIQLNSPEPMDLKMTFSNNQIALSSFYRKHTTAFSLKSQKDGLDIEHIGDNSYILVFRRSAQSQSQMRVFLQYGGNVVWQKEIPITG